METDLLFQIRQKQIVSEGSSVTYIREWISRNAFVLKLVLVTLAIIEVVEVVRIWLSAAE